MGKCNKWKWCERHRREELCYKSGIKYLCCTWSGILLFEATLRLDMNIIRPSVFISSMWRLVNCHSHTYKLKKKTGKWKSKIFPRPIKNVKLQSKLPPSKLEKQANIDKHNQYPLLIDQANRKSVKMLITWKTLSIWPEI